METTLLAGRRKTVMYVVAVDSAETTVDVTPRYAVSNPTATKTLRCPKDSSTMAAWENLLMKGGNGKGGRSGGSGKVDGGVVAQSEQEELKRLADQRMLVMPTTYTGFKTHPLYSLHRDVQNDLEKGNKGINPAKKQEAEAGVFKGEKVYFKAALEDMKSKRQWQQVGRAIKTTFVRSGDLDNRSSSSSSSSSSSINGNGARDNRMVEEEVEEPPHLTVQRKIQQRGGEAEEVTMQLYGRWQTVEAEVNLMYPLLLTPECV